MINEANEYACYVAGRNISTGLGMLLLSATRLSLQSSGKACLLFGASGSAVTRMAAIGQSLSHSALLRLLCCISFDAISCKENDWLVLCHF